MIWLWLKLWGAPNIKDAWFLWAPGHMRGGFPIPISDLGWLLYAGLVLATIGGIYLIEEGILSAAQFWALEAVSWIGFLFVALPRVYWASKAESEEIEKQFKRRFGA